MRPCGGRLPAAVCATNCVGGTLVTSAAESSPKRTFSSRRPVCDRDVDRAAVSDVEKSLCPVVGAGDGERQEYDVRLTANCIDSHRPEDVLHVAG